MTLYEQLNYIFERGYFSVVKHKEGGFLIVTVPCKQQYQDWYGDTEGMLYTDVYPTIEEAKANIFNCQLCLSKSNPHAQDNWEIVDTIHPSSLLGKGFQVGDRVTITGTLDFEGEITATDFRTNMPPYTVGYDGMFGFFNPEQLKPVLPSGSDNQTVKENMTVQKEEKKECVHDWKQVERRIRISELIETYESYPLWGCYKEGCGLVTCLDPNK